MKKLTIVLFLVLSAFAVNAQYSQFQPKDSIERKYPYILPIFGDYVYEKGFDIPYPVGVMLNYFYANQDIVIPDIAVGFSDGILPEVPLTDVTRLIDFSKVNAQATSVNFRPDVWILPFLNVYGIFGKSWARTEVELSYPFKMTALAELEGSSFGLGTTFAAGIGKYFVVLDGNWVWTNMSNFEEPVRTSVFSSRLGRAFKVGKNPESNIAFWLGAMRIKMGGVTEGTIKLNEVIGEEVWANRDDFVNNYYEWYDNADEVQQKMADRIFTPIVENIAEANGEGTVRYKITKIPKQEWNMIIGAQYQVNKVWQLRTEAGVVGNRKSLLLSVNYRFGF